jgi:hypothetical protein
MTPSAKSLQSSEARETMFGRYTWPRSRCGQCPSPLHEREAVHRYSIVAPKGSWQSTMPFRRIDATPDESALEIQELVGGASTPTSFCATFLSDRTPLCSRRADLRRCRRITALLDKNRLAPFRAVSRLARDRSEAYRTVRG